MSSSQYNIPLSELVGRQVYFVDKKHGGFLSAGFVNDDKIYHQSLQGLPNNQQRWVITYLGKFTVPGLSYDKYVLTDVKHGWNIASGQNNDDRVWHDSPNQTPSNKFWRIEPVVPGTSTGGFYLIDFRWGEGLGASDVFDGQTHHQPIKGRSNYMWDIILADVNGYCSSIPDNNGFITPVCREVEVSNPTSWNNMASAFCGGNDGGRSRLLTNSSCADWCRNNPALCDNVMVNYCRLNPTAAECKCILGATQPAYVAARNKYPEIAAPVACWAESGCQDANLINMLVPTDRKVELNNCPNVTVMRQNIDIANSGVIGNLDVNQQQTSTTVNTTPGGTAPTSPGGAATSTTTTTSGGSTYNYSGNAPVTSSLYSNLGLFILLLILVLILSAGSYMIYKFMDDAPSESVSVEVTQT